jgi:hypothetical protein
MWKLHLHDSVDMVGLKATWLANKKNKDEIEKI